MTTMVAPLQTQTFSDIITLLGHLLDYRNRLHLCYVKNILLSDVGHQEFLCTPFDKIGYRIRYSERTGYC